MADDEFEKRLREDLPRGLMRPSASRGRDRGLQARWLTADELLEEGEKSLWRSGGDLMPDALMLGRRNGKVIGWSDDRHVMLVAGSRSGKGVSLIIPNLISYGGSALVIDPKGELAGHTAGRRGQGTKAGGNGLGQDVYVLDPFKTSGRAGASFNPLAELDPESWDVVDDTAMCAEALITHPEKGERYWTEAAQALLQAIILLVLREEPERRNLVTVRRVLTLTDEELIIRGAPASQELTGMQVLVRQLRSCASLHYGHICEGVAAQMAPVRARAGGLSRFRRHPRRPRPPHRQNGASWCRRQLSSSCMN